MKVKYDIPVEEVHQRSAISIIKASGSLDVFACVNSSKIGFNITSWVPDWRSLTGTAVTASPYRSTRVCLIYCNV